MYCKHCGKKLKYDFDNCSSDSEMSIKDAMSILIKHNKWRRDNHVPNQYEMVNPTELGIAIDTAVNAMGTLLVLLECDINNNE